MNQKEIAAVEAFINEPITADNVDQPLVATFPHKEQCPNAINQYRCQLEKGHAGICEDNRPVSEISASVGASVPEPAAQQEGDSVIHNDRVLKNGIWQQAEPAPTPSRLIFKSGYCTSSNHDQCNSLRKHQPFASNPCVQCECKCHAEASALGTKEE